jgi:hypothetical protein
MHRVLTSTLTGHLLLFLVLPAPACVGLIVTSQHLTGTIVTSLLPNSEVE